MEEEGYKLSNQAVGTLMMCLQHGILNQVDITDLIKEIEFTIADIDGEDEVLVALNPPVIDHTEVWDDEEEE